ncbi:MAG: helix-turn-helix domain-containing protein, partial [Oscillibacter sp.]|nr:helix-turn-helix domain-containing protein [Oscillibacter sp.]
KEFEVLRIFLTNPKMTVTKELLINNVWGVESEATDNNVEVYISFLRKKLRYLRSRVTIRNLQRIGYRLEVETC